MPSKASGPFSAGELTTKLLGVATAVPPLPSSRAVSSGHTSQELPSNQTPSSPKHGSFDLRHGHSTAGAENEIAPPVPVNSGARLGRSATSAGRRRPDEHNPPPPPPAEMERPPLPPLPLTEMKPVTMWQQRMFISNLQRFCQVELTQSSTARDVLEILQNQGALDNGAATGWMVWEVCQDFGMERPIRSFEVLTEVCNSWIADKTVNVLMAKKTLLAPKLSRAAIPSSSPLCSGFVQHEYKRGKWQKRWMELREHSIWLSKREGGKDQVNLCSLNNFDAYVVTRVSKAPKGFVFAVKSTDNISYFESTADYIHMFTCSEKEGENWLEKILLARSYVLHQERNVLSTNTAIAGAGAGLSRAGTRKHPRPSQPLVNFGQQIIPEPSPMAPVFEPGSLLAKRTL
ncbi:hypothetical protein EW026_g2298 [Hermanssonia centrifuga]|uniref:PH domain-containing protein n=1 Tax=Hermanssonia centrifuga TaxID=98765 RepID=A0A4S4KNR5_9APHY|nr:hypothetical protein EW026_g2298 [Hermanssonia centrifuga]